MPYLYHTELIRFNFLESDELHPFGNDLHDSLNEEKTSTYRKLWKRTMMEKCQIRIKQIRKYSKKRASKY